MLPRQESERRIATMRERMAQDGIDGALFVHPVDVSYFAGTRQNATFWLPLSADPVLLVRKSLTRARQESVIDDVRPFPPSRELPSVLGGCRRIGMTFDVVPVQTCRFYADLVPEATFVDLSTANRELRAVKSDWELERMRHSGRQFCGVFAQVPGVLVPDMREIDLAAEFERLVRKAGGEQISMRAFNQTVVGLAVSGANATIPGCFDGPVSGGGLSYASPNGPGRGEIGRNVPVMIDNAGVFDGYMVDISRIFAIGPIDAEMERAFKVAIEIQAWLAERLRPGMVCEELYAGAVAIAKAQGLEDQFMGHPGEQARFVGHGLGMQLDEMPIIGARFRNELQANQTIAIEPKFTFPGKGVVGIENTFAVTPSGGENLTCHVTDEIVYL